MDLLDHLRPGEVQHLGDVLLAHPVALQIERAGSGGWTPSPRRGRRRAGGRDRETDGARKFPSTCGAADDGLRRRRVKPPSTRPATAHRDRIRDGVIQNGRPIITLTPATTVTDRAYTGPVRHGRLGGEDVAWHPTLPSRPCCGRQLGAADGLDVGRLYRPRAGAAGPGHLRLPPPVPRGGHEGSLAGVGHLGGPGASPSPASSTSPTAATGTAWACPARTTPAASTAATPPCCS